MKTSKIILISIMGVVTIFLLSLLFPFAKQKELVPTQKFAVPTQVQMKTETYALPKFSHLKVGRGCNLFYIQAKKDSFRYGYPPETKFEKPLFSLHGDTLIVKAAHKKNFYFFEIYASQLKSVSVDSARFEVKEAKVPTFRINAKTSTIELSSKALIDTAYLKLNDCTLIGSQAKIKKLETEMDHVEIRYDR